MFCPGSSLRPDPSCSVAVLLDHSEPSLCFQALSCSSVLQMVVNVKALLSETELLLAGKMSMVSDCHSSKVTPEDFQRCSGSEPQNLPVMLPSDCLGFEHLFFQELNSVLMSGPGPSPDTCSLSVQQLDPPQQDQLNTALGSVAQQLRRLADVPWLCPVIDPMDQEVNLGLWCLFSGPVCVVQKNPGLHCPYGGLR